MSIKYETLWQKLKDICSLTDDEILKKITIQDCPKTLEYKFILDGQCKLSLGADEIMIMDEYVRKHFTKPNHKKLASDILPDLWEWYCLNCPDEEILKKE